MTRDYENGRNYGGAYASIYGAEAGARAVRCLERRGVEHDFLAGACDGVLDYVQTREELAPGCYRVRRIGGAE